ncbi:MAG: glutathione S-transferase family protein [Minicystis sp.]
MSLMLHYHPLSSFCQKVLIGLYELELPFEKHLVDLGNEAARAAFLKLWPMGKFPVLRDDARRQTLPESTIILEYLDTRCAPVPRLIPTDPTRALECRLRDRFYDLHVQLPMQKIVGDRNRPEAQRDPLGVEQAQSQLKAAYAVAEAQLGERGWAAGETFGLADCAAAPALFYARRLVPFTEAHPRLEAYFARLSARPSYARVLEEAKPYMAMFPG